jgi:hypothetical protein
MQFHRGAGAGAAHEWAEQGPAAAIERRFMHLGERAIHQPGEIPFDEKAAADQEAHKAADRAEFAERNQRAEIAIDEGSQGPVRKDLVQLFDHELRHLVRGLRARRNRLFRAGPQTGRAVADGEDMVVSRGLQGRADDKLVDPVGFEPVDIGQKSRRLHAGAPDDQLRTNDLPVGKPHPVGHHFGDARIRADLNAELRQKISGRFRNPLWKGGENSLARFDQDDAQVALGVDIVEPIGDDLAGRVMQLRGEFGPCRACADDRDMQLSWEDRLALILCSEAGVDQAAVEAKF